MRIVCHCESRVGVSTQMRCSETSASDPEESEAALALNAGQQVVTVGMWGTSCSELECAGEKRQAGLRSYCCGNDAARTIFRPPLSKRETSDFAKLRLVFCFDNPSLFASS